MKIKNKTEMKTKWKAGKLKIPSPNYCKQNNAGKQKKKKNETRGPVQVDQHLTKRKSRKRETSGEKISEKGSEESISQGGMT